MLVLGEFCSDIAQLLPSALRQLKTCIDALLLDRSVVSDLKLIVFHLCLSLSVATLFWGPRYKFIGTDLEHGTLTTLFMDTTIAI